MLYRLSLCEWVTGTLRVCDEDRRIGRGDATVGIERLLAVVHVGGVRAFHVAQRISFFCDNYFNDQPQIPNVMMITIIITDRTPCRRPAVLDPTFLHIYRPCIFWLHHTVDRSADLARLWRKSF